MARDSDSVRRRIEFAGALACLGPAGQDRMSTFQELADEAFRDIEEAPAADHLQMLRESIRAHPANDHEPPRKRRHS